MTSSAEVDCQIYALVALICRDFVNSWYSRITNDTTLVSELVRVIAHVVGELERRINKVGTPLLLSANAKLIEQIDIETFLLDEIPAILETHITGPFPSHYCCYAS